MVRAIAAGLARLIRRLIGGLVLAVVVLALMLGLAFYPAEPRVAQLDPPTPEDAHYAKVIFWTLQDIERNRGGSGDLAGTVEEVNGAFRVLARARPDLRARAAVEPGGLRVDASVRLPGPGWLGWANVSAVVPEFRGEALELRRLSLGRLPLPPGLTLQALGWAADQRFGAGAAATALGVLPGLEIAGDRLVWDVALPPRGDERFSRVVMADLYGQDMPDRAEVAEFAEALVAAAEDGRLPQRGSYLPWLQMALERAAKTATPADPGRSVVTAFMAMNHLCGSQQYTSLLVPQGSAPLPTVGNVCGDAGFRDRVDLRRHFITAATIKLISDRTAAVGAGEAKELFDMIAHGGFDFTDVAANNSGIRLAELLTRADAAKIAAVRAAIRSEDDVMVALDGLPGAMPRAEFEARFGEVDSPAYLEMMAEIEARIDALPVHAGGRDG